MKARIIVQFDPRDPKFDFDVREIADAIRAVLSTRDNVASITVNAEVR